jgi:hypothetical protein
MNILGRLTTALIFGALAITSVDAADKAIVVGECATLWRTHKASADYVDPGKGARMEAWATFRKTKCGKDRDAS